MMETFEEMVKEKALWPYVPLKPPNDGYFKAMALTVFESGWIPQEQASQAPCSEYPTSQVGLASEPWSRGPRSLPVGATT